MDWFKPTQVVDFYSRRILAESGESKLKIK